MKPIENHHFLKQLNWRYAVKKFDATKKISERDWSTLEHALVLTPSSFGLQPWKFFVVDDPKVRERIRPAAWGQSQVTDASHLVVFAVRKDFGPADVEKFIARTAEVRGAPAASLDGYKNVILGFLENHTPGQLHEWAARQVYIALGNFMTAAAVLDVDACPMEGFEPPKVDEILGLPAKGYAAVVMATAGYRAADDKYAVAPKVRFPAGDVVEHV